jgi:hypothetical protein
MRRWCLALAGTLTAGLVAAARSSAQLSDLSPDLVREPAIEYFTRPPADRVTALNARLRNGTLRFAYDETSGYLKSILDALELPAESQLLVFSKTSLQTRWINPRTPRAIYFNDRVAVGYIAGAPLIEIASVDPRQGVIFYTLEQQPAAQPEIERRDFCLSCHNGRATADVPGLLLRSVAAMATGQTVPRAANYLSDHRSPFAERWAGFYVTGRSGSLTHLGNATLADYTATAVPVTRDTVNVESVADRFDASRYPSPHSDIAALLTFDHQSRMTNLLTRIGWDTRVAIAARHPDREAILGRAATEVVDYMLMVDEAPLNDRVVGSSSFAQVFAAQGPADRRGRSLRQLDLEHHLLRYPCSYMIYSDAFDALPDAARDAVYRRLWQVLSGGDRSPKYERLSAADRRAVVEILRDTKKNLPGYFQRGG